MAWRKLDVDFHIVEKLTRAQRALIERPNEVDPDWDNGLFERWRYPV